MVKSNSNDWQQLPQLFNVPDMFYYVLCYQKDSTKKCHFNIRDCNAPSYVRNYEKKQVHSKKKILVPSFFLTFCLIFSLYNIYVAFPFTPSLFPWQIYLYLHLPSPLWLFQPLTGTFKVLFCPVLARLFQCPPCCY